MWFLLNRCLISGCLRKNAVFFGYIYFFALTPYISGGFKIFKRAVERGTSDIELPGKVGAALNLGNAVFLTVKDEAEQLALTVTRCQGFNAAGQKTYAV